MSTINFEKEKKWNDIKAKGRLSDQMFEVAKKLDLNPARFDGTMKHQKRVLKQPLPKILQELCDRHL